MRGEYMEGCITTNNGCRERTAQTYKCSSCQHYEICKYREEFRELLDKVDSIDDYKPYLFSINVDCNYYVYKEPVTLYNSIKFDNEYNLPNKSNIITSNKKSYTLDGSVGATLDRDDIPKTLTGNSNKVDKKYGS